MPAPLVASPDPASPPSEPSAPPLGSASPRGSAALQALRALQWGPSPSLDRLVEGWLTALGFRAVRLWERRGTISTYEAHFGGPPFSIPARIRIHQRLR